MKIFDCFMYFDEDIVLNLRLNTLNKYVDHFVIVESKYNHRGQKRELLFKIDKFKKFEDKIIYLIHDEVPKGIQIINTNDSHAHTSWKYIENALLRENAQRNYILKGLNIAEKNDFILVSDVDEIPNLSGLDFEKITQKIIIFRQDMFYYKFNLTIPNLRWAGTKGCKKKYLISPQWLRNIKNRKYSFLRIDKLFSKTKYINLRPINNGGWHFSNIKTAKEIEHKLKSYLHHREFDEQPLSTNQIEEIIKNKKAIYDLKVDKTVNKVGNGSDLEKFQMKKLPQYIQENQSIYSEWLEK
jgi:beta-1,4-mannosyl-glycoprotein beta-1,4-N-acetylglucosaminyltransferase